MYAVKLTQAIKRTKNILEPIKICDRCVAPQAHIFRDTLEAKSF